MAPSRGQIALVAGAGAGAAWIIARRPRKLPGAVELIRAPKSTVIGSNGAVRSVQTARLALPPADFERLWTPANLENLGATYWHFLAVVWSGVFSFVYLVSVLR